MKKFKKKHTKLPCKDTVTRLLKRVDPQLALKYETTLARTPDIIPQVIREVCLAEFDPHKRANIRYYPDLHNFQIYEVPNRSLPVDKFLRIFHPFFKDPTELTALEQSLTDYRLDFITQASDWIEAYRDGVVHTCMSDASIVRCYAHPENKLALAILKAPGGNTVIARTIVNLEEKWYVRLFGDVLLVDKLLALGYNRLVHTPKAFKMYGDAGTVFRNDSVGYPYFDFPCTGKEVLPATYNPVSRLVEVIINPGITS